MHIILGHAVDFVVSHAFVIIIVYIEAFVILRANHRRIWTWDVIFWYFAVKLPELLLDANIEEETLKVLQKKLVDFLKYVHLLALLHKYPKFYLFIIVGRFS